MPRSTPLDRRTVLARSLLAAGVIGTQASTTLAAPVLQIENVTRLYPVEVARVVTPRGTDRITENGSVQLSYKAARHWNTNRMDSA